jgi:N6-L-threonylcarbamoyladenine synthase
VSNCILGIESSCDETAAAICLDGKILSNYIASQKVHEKYGGVVPELASRAHQQNIVPVVDVAIKEAGISKKDITAIAITKGPGLMGALLIGSSFAKGLALALNVPLIGVNHMQAHIMAHFIDDPKPDFPFICLTVSGGHTQLVLVKDYLDMEIIGQTIDDAAGEAFDKAAKMLGLPYPGGPLIDKYAKAGNSRRFRFAEPKVDGYNYSFSGLKTSILYFLEREMALDKQFINENIMDLCSGVQQTIVHILTKQLKQAVNDFGVTNVAIAGGVSANSGLRAKLIELGQKHGWKVFIPKFEYCTDNAAMIAISGHYLYQKGAFESQDFCPEPRLQF